jgi:hypothetical protein
MSGAVGVSVSEVPVGAKDTAWMRLGEEPTRLRLLLAGEIVCASEEVELTSASDAPAGDRTADWTTAGVEPVRLTLVAAGRIP